MWDLVKRFVERLIDFVFRPRSISGLLIRLGAAGTVATPLLTLLVESALARWNVVESPSWMTPASFGASVSMILVGVGIHIWEKRSEHAAATTVKEAIKGGDSYLTCHLLHRIGRGENEMELVTFVNGVNPLYAVKVVLVRTSDYDELFATLDWPKNMSDAKVAKQQEFKRQTRTRIDLGEMRTGQGPSIPVQLPTDKDSYVLEVEVEARNGRFFTMFVLRRESTEGWRIEKQKYGKHLDCDNPPRKAKSGPVRAGDLFLKKYPDE